MTTRLTTTIDIATNLSKTTETVILDQTTEEMTTKITMASSKTKGTPIATVMTTMKLRSTTITPMKPATTKMTMKPLTTKMTTNNAIVTTMSTKKTGKALIHYWRFWFYHSQKTRNGKVKHSNMSQLRA